MKQPLSGQARGEGRMAATTTPYSSAWVMERIFWTHPRWKKKCHYVATAKSCLQYEYLSLDMEQITQFLIKKTTRWLGDVLFSLCASPSPSLGHTCVVSPPIGARKKPEWNQRRDSEVKNLPFNSIERDYNEIKSFFLSILTETNIPNGLLISRRGIFIGKDKDNEEVKGEGPREHFSEFKYSTTTSLSRDSSWTQSQQIAAVPIQAPISILTALHFVAETSSHQWCLRNSFILNSSSLCLSSQIILSRATKRALSFPSYNSYYNRKFTFYDVDLFTSRHSKKAHHKVYFSVVINWSKSF